MAARAATRIFGRKEPVARTTPRAVAGRSFVLAIVTAASPGGRPGVPAISSRACLCPAASEGSARSFQGINMAPLPQRQSLQLPGGAGLAAGLSYGLMPRSMPDSTLHDLSAKLTISAASLSDLPASRTTDRSWEMTMRSNWVAVLLSAALLAGCGSGSSPTAFAEQVRAALAPHDHFSGRAHVTILLTGVCRVTSGYPVDGLCIRRWVTWAMCG